MQACSNGDQRVAMRGLALAAAVQRLGALKAVAAFVTEMRDVDQGGRIIGQNSHFRPSRQALNTFAQPQNRQRAQQPQRINFQCLAHGANIGAAVEPVHATARQSHRKTGGIFGQTV